MRVAILTNILTPYRIPLFEYLADVPGIDLKVFVSAPGEPDRAWQLPREFGFSCQVGPSVAVSRPGRKPLHLPAAMLPSILRFNPDLVLAGGLPQEIVGLVAARLRGAVFCTWSEATSVSDPRESSRVGRAVRRWTTRLADAGVASSTAAATYMQMQGMAPERIHVSLLSVDVQGLRASIAAQRIASEGAVPAVRRPVRFLHVGHLARYKGVDLLLATYATLSERLDAPLELWLAGDGPLRSHLAERASSSVRLLGFVQPDDMPRVWGEVDVFCLFSRGEAFGAVVAEALAAGLPCVCSRFAGAAGDLVSDGVNGFVIDPSDVESAVGRLKKLVQDQDLRGQMGRASAQMSELCSIETTGESMIKAFREIIAGRRKRLL